MFSILFKSMPHYLLILMTFFMLACGGGGSSDSSEPTEAAEIETDFYRSASTGILGTWVDPVEKDDLIIWVFFNDGTYLHAEVNVSIANAKSGMEWGAYTFDETTGKMTVSEIVDNNGDLGFSGLYETDDRFIIDISGDLLLASIDEDGDGSFEKTIGLKRADSTGIVGTWKIKQSTNPFVFWSFLEDGSYLHVEYDLVDPNIKGGMELGGYSQNETSGEMTLTPSFDNNGGAGFSAFPNAGDLTIVVEGDDLTASTAKAIVLDINDDWDPLGDTDGDGIENQSDNCQLVSNPDQATSLYGASRGYACACWFQGHNVKPAPASINVSNPPTHAVITTFLNPVGGSCHAATIGKVVPTCIPNTVRSECCHVANHMASLYPNAPLLVNQVHFNETEQLDAGCDSPSTDYLSELTGGSGGTGACMIYSAYLPTDIWPPEDEGEDVAGDCGDGRQTECYYNITEATCTEIGTDYIASEPDNYYDSHWNPGSGIDTCDNTAIDIFLDYTNNFDTDPPGACMFTADILVDP